MSAGSDCIVKLWNYELGEVIAHGIGHAGEVTSCKYSPDSKFIVTGGADGAVFIWKVPEEFQVVGSSLKPKTDRVVKKTNSTTILHLRQPEQIREIGTRKPNRNSSIVANCPPVIDIDAASVCSEARSSRK